MTLQAMASFATFENLGSDWNWDGETVMKANGYIHQLESSSFLICFHILLECLTHLRGLTVKLQMQAIDVLFAYTQVKSVISAFKQMRDNATQCFSKIFEETAKLARNLHGADFTLKRPRLNARQVHRDNIQTSSAEEYFRISLYNEFVSHIISELEARFTNTLCHSLGLLELLPNQCKLHAIAADLPEGLAQAADFYKDDLPHSVMLPSEFRMWVSKWNARHQRSSLMPTKPVILLYFQTLISSFNWH